MIGIKCERLPKVESDKSLQFFSGRIVLDETTSYFSLKESDDAISRIYFKVTDKELIQATVTAKISSAEETKILEKTIVQFIRGAQ